MKFSLSQAAREAGVSKATIHRYVKDGKLSAEKTIQGSYEIDASELFRVFPPEQSETGSETGSGTARRNGTEPLDLDAETAALDAEIKMLRELLSRVDLEHDRERRQMSETIEDLRRRLDTEGEERRALNARLLTYTQPPAPPAPPPTTPTTPEPRRGVFGFFRRAS